MFDSPADFVAVAVVALFFLSFGSALVADARRSRRRTFGRRA